MREMVERTTESGPYGALETPEVNGWIVVRAEELTIVEPPVVFADRDAALAAAEERQRDDLADAEARARFAAELERLRRMDEELDR
jgi:hypothetical protein